MDFAHIRAFIPYAVLGAGLIVVASSFQPPSATLKRSLGPVTSIAKERSQEAQPVANAEVLRNFAPQGSWFDATLSADTMREQPGTWASLLAMERPTIRVEADGATRISPADSENEGDRRELTRALQRELKRVHCYDGPIDGEWLLQSKRATKAFLDRVNASLPIDKPDQILSPWSKGASPWRAVKIVRMGKASLQTDAVCPSHLWPKTSQPLQRATSALPLLPPSRFQGR